MAATADPYVPPTVEAGGFLLYSVLTAEDAIMPKLKLLFREYEKAILAVGVDMDSFQGFNAELDGLPGKYSVEKGGCLYVALAPVGKGAGEASGKVEEASTDGDAASPSEDPYRVTVAGAVYDMAGCIALRRLDEARSEVKRLFVRSRFRGKSLGATLSLQVLEVARATKYSVALLDTLERLPAAVRLYEKLGFKRVDAYCFNPTPDVIYMGYQFKTDTPQGGEGASGAAAPADSLEASTTS